MFLGDRDQIHAACQHHRHHHTHAQRHLVADDLGRLPHRSKQRPLRGRRVARQNHSKHLEPQDGDHEKHADVQPLPDEIKCERKGDEGTERRTEADVGGDAKQHAVCPVGHQVFLGEKLDAVRERLQPAKLAAGPRGTKPVLDPAGDLPLGPDEDQRTAGDDVQNQDGRHHGRDRPCQPCRQLQRSDQKVSHRSACAAPRKPDEPRISRTGTHFVKNRTKFAVRQPFPQAPQRNRGDCCLTHRLQTERAAHHPRAAIRSLTDRSRPSRHRGCPRWPGRRRSGSRGRVHG